MNVQYLNEKHLDKIWLNASCVKLVLQIFGINLLASDVSFSTSGDEISVVCWSWIRHRAIATSEQVAQIWKGILTIKCFRLNFSCEEKSHDFFACCCANFMKSIIISDRLQVVWADFVIRFVWATQNFVGLVTPWIEGCEAMKNWYSNGWKMSLSTT